MLRKFSALFCVALISVAFVGCAPAEPDATVDTPTVVTPDVDMPEMDEPEIDEPVVDEPAIDATETAPVEGDVDVVEEVPAAE